MHIYTWRWLCEAERQLTVSGSMTERDYWWLVQRMLEAKWLMDPPKEVR